MGFETIALSVLAASGLATAGAGLAQAGRGQRMPQVETPSKQEIGADRRRIERARAGLSSTLLTTPQERAQMGAPQPKTLLGGG